MNNLNGKMELKAKEDQENEMKDTEEMKDPEILAQVRKNMVLKKRWEELRNRKKNNATRERGEVAGGENGKTSQSPRPPVSASELWRMCAHISQNTSYILTL